MKHPYRIREIAAQAGLSPATVDRVLHSRGGVRDSTAREVHRAIAELDRQRSPTRVAGPAFTIDVVPATPGLRAALSAELPGLRPAVIRPRYHPAAATGPAGLAAAVAKVGRSRSQGLILRAPDTPEIAEAVGRLGVPVITLDIDLPASKRVAHVGYDRAEAGATAAYLIEQWLADRAGDVLVVRADGDDRRASGFRAEMLSRAPNRRLLEVADGRAGVVGERTRAMLAANPSVRAVYSLHPEPGVNTAVVEAFDAAHRNYDVFVAHDLDAENRSLLCGRRLSAVLHHDRRAELRQACQAIMQAHGVLAGPVRVDPAPIQVVTPFNAPAA